jgi:hypothetical protein
MSDPFENTRKMALDAEVRLAREIERYSQVSARLFGEMAEAPGREGAYREALAAEYALIPQLQQELAYWRMKLPPFAEARDGYIILHPVTDETAHLLSEPPSAGG